MPFEAPLRGSTSIAFTPEPIFFYRRNDERLRATLSRLDEETALEQLDAAAQVLISKKSGKIVQSSFRYMTSALAQVCKASCPGLWKLLSEMGGIYDRSSLVGESVQTAIEIFNRVVSTRFSSHLVGKQLVTNMSGGTVDGLLGPAYQYLSNQKLLVRLADLAESAGCEMYEAELWARTFRVCYIWPSAVSVSRDERPGGHDEHYHAGFEVSNSETGDCAVRGKTLWLRLVPGFSDSLSCLRRPRVWRLIHMGKKLDARLGKLLAQVAREPEPEDGKLLKAQLESLRAQSLCLALPDLEQRRERKRAVTELLSGFGLVPELCARVLYGIIHHPRGSGSVDTETGPPSPLELLGRSLEGRTVHDLFVSLMREARKTSHRHRELAERAAHGVLTRPIPIVGERLRKRKRP